MNLSHGQSLMSYFRTRYRIRGLYFLDEPETALSPKSQLELLAVLTEMSGAGHAQFIIASHSPMLLACPGADIYSFDTAPVSRIRYEDTEHYKVYSEFMRNRDEFMKLNKESGHDH
jgi:predicted ATPase